MLRFAWVALCLFAVAACRLPPDRPPLKPLPDEAQVYSYGEILSRARLQSQMALEAFYLDAWEDLKDVALGLEQTARYLPKSTEPPAFMKDKIAEQSKVLADECFRLRVAAQAKNAKEANAALQNINFKIRSLRADPEAPPKKDGPEPPKFDFKDKDKKE
jgi:hypothetical protein